MDLAIKITHQTLRFQPPNILSLYRNSDQVRWYVNHFDMILLDINDSTFK